MMKYPEIAGRSRRAPINHPARPSRARRSVERILTGGLVLAVVIGCGGCGRSNSELAAAGGVVTYQGQPVEDATVTFMPEAGQPAIGRTDSAGRFQFTTQGRRGATLGSGRISITAVRQLREYTDDELDAMTAEQAEAALAAAQNSVIPRQYGNPLTSGLTATVSGDRKQNQFKFDLE